MSPEPLQGPALERFIRLCGMLGSDFEGERANAAALASRMLRESGLTWRDIIGSAPASQGQRRQGAASSVASVCDAIEARFLLLSFMKGVTTSA